MTKKIALLAVAILSVSVFTNVADAQLFRPNLRAANRLQQALNQTLNRLAVHPLLNGQPQPAPYNPQPAPYNPQPVPYNPQPVPYNPQPAPYNPQPAPYNPQPAPYNPQPAPYNPQPAPYNPQPAPYNPQPAPYNPQPAPYNPQPAPYNPAPRPITTQPTLGFIGQMLYGRGLQIMQVNPGSLAQRMGLQPADVVTHVNGTQVLSHQHYQQLLLQAAQVNSGRVVLQLENTDPWMAAPQRIGQLNNGVSVPVVGLPGHGNAHP